MFDIGWTELMVIGVVALIVIGPKDLPEMFRTLGRFTAKARGMARDFSRAMESAADEAGVKDITKDLKNVTSAKSMGLDAVKGAASKFEAWDPMKAAKPIPKTDGKPEVAAKGPATQALADNLAAKRQEVLAAAPKPAEPAKPAKSVKKTSAKAAPAKASTPKVAAKKPAAAKPAAAKAPRKPSAKKSDA